MIRFVELGSILEPGRPPKTDKAAVLLDAVRMVTQLRGEAQKLKDSNSSLQEKIKELKVSLFLFLWEKYTYSYQTITTLSMYPKLPIVSISPLNYQNNVNVPLKANKKTNNLKKISIRQKYSYSSGKKNKNKINCFKIKKQNKIKQLK
jgi:hypothetical protein